METIINFVKEAFNNFGGSLNVVTLKTNPTNGYMVSSVGYEQKIHINPRYKKDVMIAILTEQVLKFAHEHIKELQSFDNVYLGLWFDKEDGLWYLDISLNIEDKDKAIEIARANKQIAIWDCENKETIYTYFKN